MGGGMGMGMRRCGSSSGTPTPTPGYTAKAVHFDGATTLHIASLAATDNAFFSFALWQKAVLADLNSGPTLYASDPEGTFNDCAFTNGIGADFTLQCANVDGSKQMNMNSLANAIPDGVWQCFMGSIDSSAGVMKLYAGDIDFSAALGLNNSPFTMVYNALSFWFGGDNGGDQIIADFADVRIMPGASLLAGGDIVQATRRLFIDGSGKPVDPAVATAALGTPTILFSGDHTTFPTNQGTGGAFVLTGTLTDASTHP